MTVASVYFGLMTSVQEVAHQSASVVSPQFLVPLSLEQREVAQNNFAAKRLMTPASVLTSSFLCLVQAICSRSPPSIFREGGFVLYRSSRQQMLLLAAM